MSQHDTLTHALQDAASSLETISRLAGKAAHPNGDETCMGTFPEVRGYATSRAAVARAALSATQPAKAAQGEPLPEHADHVPEIAARLRLVARFVGCADAIPEDDRTAVGCIFSVLGNMRRALELKQAAQGEPAEHWHRLYLEKCQQYNDRVAQLGGVIEGLEAEAAQGAGEVVAELKRLASVCPELNLNNYGPDDVDELNAWAVEVAQAIDQLSDTQPAAGADVLDAVRYRMVRRGQHWSVINGIGDTLRGDDLDAAIDAQL